MGLDIHRSFRWMSIDQQDPPTYVRSLDTEVKIHTDSPPLKYRRRPRGLLYRSGSRPDHFHGEPLSALSHFIFACTPRVRFLLQISIQTTANEIGVEESAWKIRACMKRRMEIVTKVQQMAVVSMRRLIFGCGGGRGGRDGRIQVAPFGKVCKREQKEALQCFCGERHTRLLRKSITMPNSQHCFTPANKRV